MNSTCLFVWGCSTEANTCLMMSFVHNLHNCWLANWCSCQTLNILESQNDKQCSSIQSAEPCGQLFAQLVQLLSTWWNTQWSPPSTSFGELLVGMDPRCLFPKYGKARSYIWTATPLGVHDANQCASDFDHIVAHTSCSVPSWSANSTPSKQPLEREFIPRHDFHKCLHRAMPWCVYTDPRLCRWG